MEAELLSVTVNGEPRQLPAGATVSALLAQLAAAAAAHPGPCAVEVNRAIVPRSRHDQHALADGDMIEIVSFVGGG